MIQVYQSNGWNCVPVGLFESSKERVNSDNNERAVLNEETLIGVAMLSGKPMKFAGMNYTCQYGPYLQSYDDEVVKAFFQQVIDILRKLNCSKFSINPAVYRGVYDLQGNQTATCDNLNEDVILGCGYTKKDMDIDTNGQIDMRYMFKKNIEFKSVQELRESYTSKTRRELKNAQSNLLQIAELNFEDIDKFTKLMQMSGEKHGYRVHGSEYYKQLKTEFKDDALFLLAKLDCDKFIEEKSKIIVANNNLITSYDGNNRKGRITKLEEVNARLKDMITLVKNSTDQIDGYIYMTAGVYVEVGNELIHFLSGNDPKYAKFASSTLMQDYAMSYGLEKKLEVFNMYGVAGDFSKNDSVFTFKTGFGGYVTEYVGTYMYELAPLRLKLNGLLKKITGKN